MPLQVHQPATATGRKSPSSPGPCFTTPTPSTQVSPFDALPLEVLQEIFLRCLPLPLDPASVLPEHLYHSLDIQGATPKVAPLLLCQISRHWRTSALALPRLWMSLDVFISMGKSHPPPPLIALWLSRSRSVPVYLSLHQQNESLPNRFAAGEVLEVFNEHVCHWGGVDLRLAAEGSYCRVLGPDQRAAPMLKEFKMVVQNGAGSGGGTGSAYGSPFPSGIASFPPSPTAPIGVWGPPGSVPASVGSSPSSPISWGDNLWGIFASVPRLSRLHLSKIPDLGPWAETALPVPWDQLTSLSLEYVPSVVTAVCILGKCPSLIEVNFKVDSMNASFPMMGVTGQLLDEDEDDDEAAEDDEDEDENLGVALVPSTVMIDDDETPIQFHGNLTSLVLNIDHSELPRFFDIVALPSLTSLALYIRGPLDQYPWPYKAFEAFLKRNKSPLTSLELYDTGMRGCEFVRLVRMKETQGIARLVVQDRRDWTWEPFVTDFAMGLMTHSAFGGGALSMGVGMIDADVVGLDEGADADGNGNEDADRRERERAQERSADDPALAAGSVNSNSHSSGNSNDAFENIPLPSSGARLGYPYDHSSRVEPTDGNGVQPTRRVMGPATFSHQSISGNGHESEREDNDDGQGAINTTRPPPPPSSLSRPVGQQRPPPCSLPLLESLTLRGSCIWTKDGSIADMVESRWRFHQYQQPEIRRIRRLAIEIHSGHVEDVRRLKEFASEGLDLDLAYR